MAKVFFGPEDAKDRPWIEVIGRAKAWHGVLMHRAEAVQPGVPDGIAQCAAAIVAVGGAWKQRTDDIINAAMPPATLEAAYGKDLASVMKPRLDFVSSLDWQDFLSIQKASAGLFGLSEPEKKD